MKCDEIAIIIKIFKHRKKLVPLIEKFEMLHHAVAFEGLASAGFEILS